jgi:YYY domain-containing protein
MMEFGLVALWLVVSLLLGSLALPVAAWLFTGLDAPALAFPLALAMVGVVGHLVGHVAFGWPAAVAGVSVLAGGSYATAGRVDPDWRRFAGAAAVFVAAFLLAVGVRAVDPAAAPLPLSVGEKFLDFGLVRALGRAPALPPEDVWFAGEPVRYYYGGHMLTVLLGTLTDTGGRFAYNLGLAAFYATLVTGAYGLAGSIATPYDVPHRLAAAFGAFFVGLAGNLETAARVVAWLVPDGPAGRLARALGLREAAGWSPGDFWYFDASRVIPVDPTAEDPFMAATEFPLFSWLNGDLHAHMMSQPFTLLVAALLLAYWRADDPRRRLLLLCGAVPPVAGLVGLVNVWSFPTVGGLVLLAVLFAPGDPAEFLRAAGAPGLAERLGPRASRAAEELRRLGFAAVAAATALVLGVLWTLPFWTVIVPGGPGKEVAFWEAWSPAGGLLLVHGAFLAAFAPYLARPLGVETGRPWLVWAVGLGAVAVAVLLGAPALGLAVPLLAGGWWLLRARTDAGAGFELVLVLAGTGIVLLVELLTVEGERFNIIFKAYSHVWLLWAVAAGVALARLVEGWPAAPLGLDRPRWRTTGRALAAVLLVSTALYAGFALPTHVDNGSATVETNGPTLDATAYVESGGVESRHGVDYRPEAPAIRWLEAREGRPTIVTAAPGGYWWRPAEGDGSSAPASLTGLPTVLGWFHERQYRGSDAYRQRLGHVEAIYAGQPADQRELLARYDVEYVYVGPAERATYEVTVEDLKAVEPAREWEHVTVYEVNRTAL